MKTDDTTPDQNKKSSNNKTVKVLVYVFVAILVVVGLQFFQNGNIIFQSNHDRIKQHLYSENMNEVVEIFNKKYAGTEDEKEAIEILKTFVESRITSLNFSEFDNVIKSLDSEDPQLKMLSDGLQKIQLKVGINNIYADPQSYIGKEVLIVGDVTSNDLKRKVLRVESNDKNASVECSYEFVQRLGLVNIDWVNYSAWGGPGIVYGHVRKYNNSDDAYIEILNFCDEDFLNTIRDWDF